MHTTFVKESEYGSLTSAEIESALPPVDALWMHSRVHHRLEEHKQHLFVPIGNDGNASLPPPPPPSDSDDSPPPPPSPVAIEEAQDIGAEDKYLPPPPPPPPPSSPPPPQSRAVVPPSVVEEVPHTALPPPHSAPLLAAALDPLFVELQSLRDEWERLSSTNIAPLKFYAELRVRAAQNARDREGILTHVSLYYIHAPDASLFVPHSFPLFFSRSAQLYHVFAYHDCVVDRN